MQDERGARGATCFHRLCHLLGERSQARCNGRTRSPFQRELLKLHSSPYGGNRLSRADGGDFTTIACCLTPTGNSLEGIGVTWFRAGCSMVTAQSWAGRATSHRSLSSYVLCLIVRIILERRIMSSICPYGPRELAWRTTPPASLRWRSLRSILFT